MRAEEIRIEADSLNLSEKIRLVESLWDSIAANNSQLPMTKWQEKELDKRYHDYKQGQVTLHPWNDVHTELREKFE